jgi:GNAT superfamily N-acetyltransferase
MSTDRVEDRELQIGTERDPSYDSAHPARAWRIEIARQDWLVRDADLPRDLDAVVSLWREYLAWGNDELESRYGFRFAVDETLAADLAAIDKYLPPDGRLLLAFEGPLAMGIVCLRRIGPGDAEIKRMYVQPSRRGGGIGRALLERVIQAAEAGGYERIRLDTPEFTTAAHRLYRAHGFVEVKPYPESEIPDERKRHWLFMERLLA